MLDRRKKLHTFLFVHAVRSQGVKYIVGTMDERLKILNKAIVLCAVFMFIAPFLFSQEAEILSYISNKSTICKGGSNVYSYEGTTYVISVSQVIVGTKSESYCRTVGAAKAKRDMLSFVNGSEITSYTELKMFEKTVGSSGEIGVESVEVFTEYIREDVIGHINGVCPLGGWLSEDGSVYYYAVYKIIE